MIPCPNRKIQGTCQEKCQEFIYAHEIHLAYTQEFIYVVNTLYFTDSLFCHITFSFCFM